MLNMKNVTQNVSPSKALAALGMGFGLALAALLVLALIFKLVVLTLTVVGQSAGEVWHVYQMQVPLVQLVLLALVGRALWVLLARYGIIERAQQGAYVRMSSGSRGPTRKNPHTRSARYRSTQTTRAYDPFDLPAFHRRSQFGSEALYYGG